VDATRVDVTADTVVNTADPAILSEERPSHPTRQDIPATQIESQAAPTWGRVRCASSVSTPPLLGRFAAGRKRSIMR
jgi:hypothetical protein